MVSNTILRVLRTYAHVDTEIGLLALKLNGTISPAWRSAFRRDLSSAIRNGTLTANVANQIMMSDFEDDADVDEWLREAWAEWFPGEPYPRG